MTVYTEDVGTAGDSAEAPGQQGAGNHHARLPDGGAQARAAVGWSENFEGGGVSTWDSFRTGSLTPTDDPTEGWIGQLAAILQNQGASAAMGITITPVDTPTTEWFSVTGKIKLLEFELAGIGLLDAAGENGFYLSLSEDAVVSKPELFAVVNGEPLELGSSSVGGAVTGWVNLTWTLERHISDPTSIVARFDIDGFSGTVLGTFDSPAFDLSRFIVIGVGNPDNPMVDDLSTSGDGAAALVAGNYHARVTPGSGVGTATNDFSPASAEWVAYADAAFETEDDPTEGWIGVSSNLGTGNGAQASVTLAPLGGTVYLPTVVGDEILLTVRIRKQAESLGTYFGLANATGDQSIQVVYLPHVSPERAKVITINGNVWTNHGDSIDNLPDTENGEWIDASLLIQMKFPGTYSAIFTVHGVSLDTGTIHNLDDRAPFTHFQLGSDGDISFTPVVAFSSFAVDNVSVDSPAGNYHVRLPADTQGSIEQWFESFASGGVHPWSNFGDGDFQIISDLGGIGELLAGTWPTAGGVSTTQGFVMPQVYLDEDLILEGYMVVSDQITNQAYLGMFNADMTDGWVIGAGGVDAWGKIASYAYRITNGVATRIAQASVDLTIGAWARFRMLFERNGSGGLIIQATWGVASATLSSIGGEPYPEELTNFVLMSQDGTGKYDTLTVDGVAAVNTIPDNYHVRIPSST